MAKYAHVGQVQAEKVMPVLEAQPPLPGVTSIKYMQLVLEAQPPIPRVTSIKYMQLV